MDISSIALQGLDQAQQQLDTSARRLASNGPSSPVDTVDLSQQAVSILSAKNLFNANIQVLKIVDDMQKNVINLLA